MKSNYDVCKHKWIKQIWPSKYLSRNFLISDFTKNLFSLKLVWFYGAAGLILPQANLIFSNPVFETIRLVRFGKYENHCLLDNFFKNHPFMTHRHVRLKLRLETEICATFEWWLGDDSRARLSERVKPSLEKFSKWRKVRFFPNFFKKTFEDFTIHFSFQMINRRISTNPTNFGNISQTFYTKWNSSKKI